MAIILIFGCTLEYTANAKPDDPAPQDPPPDEDPVSPDIPDIPQGSDHLAVWTVGDSITLGTNNGYRNRVWEGMTGAGYSIDFLGNQVHPYPDSAVCPDADHDGYSGNTIGDIADKIDDLYSGISADDPDMLLIMLGTNDLAWWVSGEPFVDSCDERMTALVDHIFSLDPDISIIVGTIPPMSHYEIREPNIDRAVFCSRYNGALTEQVRGHDLFGTRLFLADVFGALETEDLYDGIHPTSAGYDKTGNAWLEAITGYLSVIH